MPFTPKVKKEYERLVNCFGNAVYPLLLSLCLPLFLNKIIMEKEQRLIQNMKINGLQMVNYWITNGVCNFLFYMLQAAVYYAWGRYVSDLAFFTETNPALIWLTFVGWGFSQISLAFLY